ncbi:YhcH/YjgK/YiaL family protein [Acetatifactor muris]|uniref:YhcH/YjgK/YiaL family protein n=1 Tax=Acetatifactor muris TaxID=879566 RepID=UPI0023F2E855|nr:YhcH/YjgK/YiaL family protein [Acetatifactor muris]
MIFSSIYANDDLSRYPEAIQKAIRFVAETDFEQMEDGRIALDGDNMFANLFHITTKAPEEARPEMHRKYIDVQFWISGEELCGVAPYQGGGNCVESREEEDLYFYDQVENETLIHAVKGCYAVFFPNDIHRPGIWIDRHSVHYRKVVVKVDVDLLRKV